MRFRIYSGPLTAAQIAADHALGPNQMLGTSTNVSLTAALAGGNVVVSWPTASALVNLVSSPALGRAAVLVFGKRQVDRRGGNYQAAMPAAGTASSSDCNKCSGLRARHLIFNGAWLATLR